MDSFVDVTGYVVTGHRDFVRLLRNPPGAVFYKSYLYKKFPPPNVISKAKG